MSPFALRLALLLLLAAAAKPAWADEPGPVATDWYGGESLLADVFGVAAIAGCAQKLESDRTLCFGLFVLPGPVVHATQGYLDRAWLSAAYRLVLSLAGAGIGHVYERGCGQDEFLCITDTWTGLLLGMAAAMTIDAVVAFEPAGPARTPAMMPTVALAPGTLAVGFIGRF